jgi:hypothetical protein
VRDNQRTAFPKGLTVHSAELGLADHVYITYVCTTGHPKRKIERADLNAVASQEPERRILTDSVAISQPTPQDEIAQFPFATS